MRVIVSGATGFVGRAVVEQLRTRGDVVVALSRDPVRAVRSLGEGIECLPWTPDATSGPWVDAVRSADAVVHLAGEPVMAHRWSDRVKATIRDSRVLGARHLVDAILAATKRPRVFVSASGMDYYGDTGERAADESSPLGRSFLASVCDEGEREVRRLDGTGVREVRLRIGLVLGEAGGALEQIAMPFRFFVGGPLAGGRPWTSWIHRDDLVAVILRALDHDTLHGPFNAVAPEPVRLGDFASTLGAVMHRPSWAPVPAFALRVMVGEGAEVLVQSRRVVPRALLDAGYTFKFSNLREALASVIARPIP